MGTDWRRGACRDYDLELFYSDDPLDQERACGICALCPIKTECLQYALDIKEEFGVWGGLTAKQRKAAKVKKQRVHCPGCDSTDVEASFLVEGHEICRSCALSWRV